MEILITGKNSYIGNKVGAFLETHSHNVTYQSLKDVDLSSLDFRGFKVIFHVAGIAHVSYKNKDSKRYDEINHLLTKAVALKAKEEGVEQFVFMSSMIVYQPSKDMITINTQTNPIGPYAKSKLNAEKALESLKAPNFKIAIIRPSMIYGLESRGNFSRLLNLTKKSPFFPDYPNLRSFLFIDHLSSAIHHIIQDQLEGIFHLSDDPISTSKLVQVIANTLNKKILIKPYFNLLIRPFLISKTINKLFGNYYYSEALIQQSFNYRKYSLEERMKRSLYEI